MKHIVLVKDRNKFWEIYHDILTGFGYQVTLIDIFKRSEQEILFSDSFDAFIWRAKHTPSIKQLARRFIYFFDVELGVNTFPTWREFWHYDDKISQYLIFKEKNIPCPQTFVFFNREEALEFANNADYPLIYKCPFGAGSANVGILTTKSQAISYIKKAFGKGLKTYFKTEIQKGYVLFQEFLRDNNGDYRIVCHGKNQISGFFRQNRQDSPFASGSGQFDLGELPEDLLTFVADVHQQLNYDIMSYDILKDNEGKWSITEMSVIFGDLTHVVYDQALNYEKNSQGRWEIKKIEESRHERFIKHLLKRWQWHD